MDFRPGIVKLYFFFVNKKKQEFPEISAFNVKNESYSKFVSGKNSICKENMSGSKGGFLNSGSMPHMESKYSDKRYKDLRNYVVEKSILSDDNKQFYASRGGKI
jgi:hypothetical protein